MKIIQIMPEFGLAGAETMCENLTYELVSMGHEVVVVSLYDYHSPITERIENNSIRLLYLGKKRGIDFSMVKKLRQIFKNECPDVIHTHRYLLKYVIAAKGKKNIHVVHTIHNVAQKENLKLDRVLNKFFFHKNMATPVALTKLVKDSIIEEYKLSAERVPIVFNGIPLDRCIRKTQYSFGNKLKVLHIGRYSEAKNHRNMIEAVVKLHEKHPQLELHLIGEGGLKEQVSSLIMDFHANSFIIEHGTTSNPYKYLSEADIFLLPSKYEGMPMTLIEAMGTGVPIVASNVGGIPDMIQDKKTGLLCKPDVESIINALQQLIDNRVLRESLGQSALKEVENFSAKVMAEKYLKIYQS